MPRSKQFKKQEVLEKAMLLFWEKGYHATSMNDLVEKLGINRASMYNTFGSKSDLFLDAIDMYIESRIKQYADFLYYQLNVRQGLQILYTSIADELINDELVKGCFIVNSTTEMANINKEVIMRCSTFKKKMEEVYMNYLKYGVQNGQISTYKNVATISKFLYALQVSINVTAIKGATKEELLQLATYGLTVLD